MNDKHVQLVARFLVSAWVLWWTFFAVATLMSDHGPVAAKAFRFGEVALFFWGSLLVAWRWPVIGSLLLILEGLAVCACFPAGLLRATPASAAFLIATLASPPLIAGVLLTYSYWRKFAHHAA